MVAANATIYIGSSTTMDTFSIDHAGGYNLKPGRVASERKRKWSSRKCDRRKTIKLRRPLSKRIHEDGSGTTPVVEYWVPLSELNVTPSTVFP
jgi:hypothetical protein